MFLVTLGQLGGTVGDQVFASSPAARAKVLLSLVLAPLTTLGSVEGQNSSRRCSGDQVSCAALPAERNRLETKVPNDCLIGIQQDTSEVLKVIQG